MHCLINIGAVTGYKVTASSLGHLTDTSATGRSKQGTRGPGTRDRGPGTEDRGPGTEDRGPRTGDRGPRTEDRGPGTEDQDPVLDPFFCMGGCGTHIAITSAKHQDFALHCRIHLCSYS